VGPATFATCDTCVKPFALRKTQRQQQMRAAHTHHLATTAV
jgi:hypothetical protein